MLKTGLIGSDDDSLKRFSSSAAPGASAWYSRRCIIVSILVRWSVVINEKDEGSKQQYLLRLVVFLCLICLCLSCSTVVSPQSVTDPNTAGDPNAVTDAEQRARDMAMRSATNAATGGFRPSLEMKENADFLISPALLMQEALSDEIVTTYPSE